jgi:hypothetical protein
MEESRRHGGETGDQPANLIGRRDVDADFEALTVALPASLGASTHDVLRDEPASLCLG